MQVARNVLSFLIFATSFPVHAKATPIGDRLYVAFETKQWKQFDSDFILKRPLTIFEKLDGKARGFLETEISVLPGKRSWREEIEAHCAAQSKTVSAGPVRIVTSKKLPGALVCQFTQSENGKTVVYSLVYTQPPKSKLAVKVQTVVLTIDLESRKPASTVPVSEYDWIIDAFSFQPRGKR